ncbi:MAG: histidinol-phosphate aminotransferase [Candidatus Endobugula sp.]|jgi:histidinol-phosphate aminotransferase
MSVIKDHIVALSAYKPPLEGRNPDAFIMLDFNERTIPVGEAIKQALHDYIDAGRLQMYPSYGDIVPRLAEYVGVDASQLMITNGSDQGIDLVFRAVAEPNSEAIIPGPSFAMYNQCAKVEAMTIIGPLYTPTGGYPVDDVLAAITPNTRLIVISNPNNPCGTIVSTVSIKAIAKAAPQAAILVDECYFEYSQATVVSAVDSYPNLFVTRTFSKTWGIPSLRFAYLVSAAENILALCNIRGPYDINQLAIVAANAALDKPEYTQHYVAEVMQQAKPLVEAWLDAHDIDYWLSSANYLWCFPDGAEEIGEYLQANGFLVRPKPYQGRVGLRITMGTVEQMQQLITVWGQYAATD